MKFYYTIFLIFSLSSCTTFHKSETPVSVIREFYKNYFAHPNKIQVPYSESFTKLIIENAKICKEYAKGDICGWGADNDVFLDGQDYDQNLNQKNSHFEATKLNEHNVKVTFNLFPESKDPANSREIFFEMKNEKRRWVINDIIYKDGISARDLIQAENREFLPR